MPRAIQLAGSWVIISCIDSGISTAPEPTSIIRRSKNTWTSQAVS